MAVVIQEKSIKAILITETSDDEAFFQRAMGVVKNVLKTQSTEVDTVSGATYSSKGILGAIQNALKQAEKVTNGETIEEKADTTQLEEAIKTAEALVQEEYTEASWSVLAVRLQDAKEMLETAGQTSVKQETVDKAVENLNLAVAQLEKKKSDQEEEVKTKYIDGTYEVSVPCKPDEDEDFTDDTLVLTMEHSQLEKIFEKYPSAREENVYVLTELVGDELEILDPYGGSLQSYGLCYETMRKSIIKLVKL